MTEQAIRINTRDGQDVFTTDIFEGKLDAVIVRIPPTSIQKITLMIESELGYFILNRKDLEGVEYIAPRKRAVTQVSDKMRLQDIPSMDKFNLNERLIITVMGPKNIDVDLILRLD
ncbi:hypothetical protein LCGC14_2272390 [marine sediment metagenome]|uniref:Uncharacterized protein n=1 Tax=marine sediment metagenome TaxID=412755 RepID=A0A0F9DIV9_9ZZZZ